MNDAALAARCAHQLDALAELPAPLAYVDLDAFEYNARAMLAQAAPLPIRIASKSLRCLGLIEHALSLDDRFRGVMAFSVQEAVDLARGGINDILIAYPSTEAAPLQALAEHLRDHPGHVVRPMVDDPAHAAAIAAAARTAGVRIRVCVDVDAGWRPLGRRGPAIGPKRSPLRTPQQVAALIRRLAADDALEVDGLMIYDGQIAGVGDQPPGRALRARAIGVMQRASLAELRSRVPRVVAAAREAIEAAGGTLRLVNVGGTGSLQRIKAVEGATELTAGSGFYAPTLFDTYSGLSLQPAAFFVLPVVRKPSPALATALGGGYVASGAAGADRLPRPVHPAGLRLDSEEGAGEVQTPLAGNAAAALRIGDRVVMRHAKAGELAERFAELHLVRDGELTGCRVTYRGSGRTYF